MKSWQDMRSQAIANRVLPEVDDDDLMGDELDIPDWACKKCGGSGMRTLVTTNELLSIGCPDCYETGVADLSLCTLFMEDES